ncbi:MAG: M28 family metallopeptidase [Pseudomonadota bacterium]
MGKMLMAVLSGLVLLASSANVHAQAKADKEAIRAHLNFLADDLLEGRETGSRGYDIAARYVAAQFGQYRLAPKGDKAGFFQHVPMRLTSMVPGSALVEIETAAGAERLTYGSDYYVDFSEGADRSNAATPMVFIGYGIRAERFKHDDYAGRDVKGKIVVVLRGKPSNFPTEEGAHFGSSREKTKLALERGAVGMVFLYTPDLEKIRPFDGLRDDFTFPSADWIDASGKASNARPGLQDVVLLSLTGAKKLFAQADTKLDDIYAAAAANKPLPYFDLKKSLRLSRRTVSSEISGSNVVGMIEGSDPRLKNEYVVFSAHLDHVGQMKEKSGDNIYNGAMDNASGVATLIETARLFSVAGRKPKRSILFIALTGEEKGLLGSDFFARNPTVPAGSIVANVNLDMPLLTFDFKNVMAFGAEHSSLKGNVQRAVTAMGLDLIPDPWPAQGLFTRSDHYSFVRQGIPSIFLATGMASFKKDENAGKLWEEFLGKHYHKPSDDLKLPFNFDAAARFAQVNYNIGREIANAPNKPTWNKGDFFGDTFRK